MDTTLTVKDDKNQEIYKEKRGTAMAAPTKGSLVYVYDKEGNAYLCEFSALKDPKKVSEREKANCTDLDRGMFTRND